MPPQKVVAEDDGAAGGDIRDWRTRNEQPPAPKQGGGDSWEQQPQAPAKEAKQSPKQQQQAAPAPQQQQAAAHGEVGSLIEPLHGVKAWRAPRGGPHSVLLMHACSQDAAKIVRAADIGREAYRPGAVVSSEEKVGRSSMHMAIVFLADQAGSNSSAPTAVVGAMHRRVPTNRLGFNIHVRSRSAKSRAS